MGGGAPILLEAVPGDVDEATVDVEADELAAGNELRSARGPFGGALPDIIGSKEKNN